MFCSSCGKQIADDAKICSDCGTTATISSTDTKESKKEEVDGETVGDIAATLSDTEKSTETEQKEKPKSDIDTDVGAFFKDFFKDPFDAVLKRSKPKYMVWGLIVLGVYALLVFLGQLAASTGAGYAFASMFCLVCGLAAMIFGFFLFQAPLKLEKKSLNEIVAVVGLSMTPMFLLFFIGSVLDAAAFSYLNVWQSVLNLRLFTSPMVTVGYVFSALILGRAYSGDDPSKMKRSYLLVLIAFAALFLIESLFMYVAIRVG